MVSDKLNNFNANMAVYYFLFSTNKTKWRILIVGI